MFFDVTRAGTDRPLRVAVAAIAYLDTLLDGCVLHLVGGQGLQVRESASEIEERALAVQPITATDADASRGEGDLDELGPDEEVEVISRDYPPTAAWALGSPVLDIRPAAEVAPASATMILPAAPAGGAEADEQDAPAIQPQTSRRGRKSR